jgi:hypothetical protein
VFMSQCLLRMCIAQIVNFEFGVVPVADRFHVNVVTRRLGKSMIGFLCAIGRKKFLNLPQVLKVLNFLAIQASSGLHFLCASLIEYCFLK